MSRPFVDMNDSYSYEDWMNDMATNEEACARDSFYNTTSESGPQLAEYQAKASDQNAVVLWLFQRARRPLSPSEVHDAYPCPLGLPQPPLTSIRSAITTLTNAGALVKTDQKREGVYGRMEHVWALSELLGSLGAEVKA